MAKQLQKVERKKKRIVHEKYIDNETNIFKFMEKNYKKKKNLEQHYTLKSDFRNRKKYLWLLSEDFSF